MRASTATMRAGRSEGFRGSGRSKKSPIASEREEGARDLWWWLAQRFDAGRLVFVDKCGMHTSMTRLRARAPTKGQRAYGKVPPLIQARTPR
jgi:hypothetical protein